MITEQTRDQEIAYSAYVKAFGSKNATRALWDDELFRFRVKKDDNLFYETIVRKDNLSIFFSHEFAKAFWGEEKVDDFGCRVYSDYRRGTFTHPYTSDGINGDSQTGYSRDQYENMQLAWQYHLQQMVLEENPLKYLEKFL
jgi:hypothetical protein